MTAKNPKAVYACVNFSEILCPREIERQSICIAQDIGMVLKVIKTMRPDEIKPPPVNDVKRRLSKLTLPCLLKKISDSFFSLCERWPRHGF